MTQLALDLGPPPAPSLGNFIAGENGEALSLIQRLAAGERPTWLVYLWGQPGCGRSHLISALKGSGAVGLEATGLETTGVEAPAARLWAVDDCDLLDADGQQRLFDLINAIRSRPGDALVVTGSAPPLALSMREDLRSRLGWSQVFELAPLSDQDKARVLDQQARERGLAIAPDVIPWMLTHVARDSRSLIALIDALDRFSLQRQRRITLALVRELLTASPPAPES